MDVVKGLWEDEPEQGEELVEVVLECVFAANIDVARLPLKHKCLALRVDQAPWAVGRLQQQQLFARLVPNEALRNNISRVHFELAWEPPALFLKKTTPNTLLVNGVPAPPNKIPLGHGSHIGLCQAGAHAPFLAFCLLLRDSSAVSAQGFTPQPTVPDMPMAAAGHTLQAGLPPPPRPPGPPNPQQPPPMPPQQPAAMMDTPAWNNAGPATPYCLVCTFARGCEVASVPPASKTISHPGDARVVVGRQHQPGFFEGLLRSEEKLLSFISRSHLEFNPAPGQPQAFDLANLSSNPIMVSQSLTTGRAEKLTKSDRTVVKPPVSIDFIAAVDQSSSSPVVFLRLAFEAATEPRSASQLAVPPTAAPAAALPPTAQAAHAGRPSNPCLDQSTYDIGRMLPPSSSKGGQQPPATKDRRRSATGNDFFLELSGSVVREGLPPTRKTVESADGSLTIGRRHQQELLSEALRDGVAQFVSRDHFQVKVAPSGYTLVALGSNPIWRVRAGESMEVKGGQMPLPMQPGDKVQLFTGASDGTAEGPGSRGTFFWILHGPSRGTDDDLLSGDTVTVAHTRRAANAVLASRVAADSPGPPQTRQSREGGVTPTIGGGANKGGGALQVPVALSFDSEGSPNDHGRHASSSGSKYNEADDAFSKSGFNFH